MHKLGLKLFSTNTDFYFEEAKRLYEENLFDYIELFVVPDSLETLSKWKQLAIPFVIHNAHFRYDFNLAKKECVQENKRIYLQSKEFADELKADIIIFHAGIDGNIEESARQLNFFDEKRAVIENKPYVALPNNRGAELCRGATVEEISFILQEVDCGFCLDIGHAICAANALQKDRQEFLEAFSMLNPVMYHLTDVEDINSIYDTHINIGKGELDFIEVLKFVPDKSLITLETNKKFFDNIDDFQEDVQIFRKLEKNYNYNLNTV